METLTALHYTVLYNSNNTILEVTIASEVLPCSISISLDAQLNVKVLYKFVVHLYAKNYSKASDFC